MLQLGPEDVSVQVHQGSIAGTLSGPGGRVFCIFCIHGCLPHIHFALSDELDVHRHFIQRESLLSCSVSKSWMRQWSIV